MGLTILWISQQWSRKKGRIKVSMRWNCAKQLNTQAQKRDTKTKRIINQVMQKLTADKGTKYSLWVATISSERLTAQILSTSKEDGS